MMFSYIFFLRFISSTGTRYLEAQTEILLAREIHGALVPPLAGHLAGPASFEYWGVSAPSGEVGGDLADVMDLSADGWIAYVADVSGHGVSSGVLMGMVKSATHMKVRSGARLDALVTDLNRVLYRMKQPNMFVTFAGVRCAPSGSLEFIVAGHLPILRVARDGHVEEITTPQIPIGVIEDYAFGSGVTAVEPGDLLALVTDGLTEVFDRDDQEFGLERLNHLLCQYRERPLAEIGDRMLAAVRAHGTQLDDQTMLLVRREG